MRSSEFTLSLVGKRNNDVIDIAMKIKILPTHRCVLNGLLLSENGLEAALVQDADS
jgi:hypothetical protein